MQRLKQIEREARGKKRSDRKKEENQAKTSQKAPVSNKIRF
jgi:hypothetical protein